VDDEPVIRLPSLPLQAPPPRNGRVGVGGIR
jgi:hypothetical protein